MQNQVVMNDVGPRDGLQNQANILSVEQRLSLIAAIREAGVKNIEMGAFVSPKAVPAMAGTAQIAERLPADGATYSALVPNVRGYEMALEAGVTTVAMVVYGSDAMAEKNVGMSSEQAEQATIEMVQRSQQDGVKVIATLGVAFACPFAGPTPEETARALTSRCLEAGVDRVVIADTIGAANPAQVSSLLQQLVTDNGADRLGCHFHDTRALGMANLYAALDAGVRYFDASVAGLGGCPFAPGASGNIATEDAVMMLHSMGYDTGIDLTKLLTASDFATQLTGTAPGGRSKPWLTQYLAKGHSLRVQC